ncbi:MAG: flagellar biosynthetic protein FliO [Pseudothermotoga sp.]
MAFAFLIGFLGIVYFLVRRRNIFAVSKNVKVLERYYIDRNCSVVLVRIMDSYFFLLVTPNNATIIKELSQNHIGQLEQSESFSNLFFRKLGRREKGNEEK